MTVWFVYLVEGRQGQLYCGITTDVERRVAEHNGEAPGRSGRGARWARAHGPVTLVWHREVGSRSEALRVEARIKRLRRAQKLALVGGELALEEIVNLAE